MTTDTLEFADEVDETSSQNLESWKVLIVDDETEIHSITRLALEDFIFDNKRLKFLSAYSGTDARQIMEEHPDVAVTLLDVIMESEDAGLLTAKYIRETLQNRAIRIILRTGQPGQFPERQAIVDYDIDDYKAKTEFTSQKLFTTIITALRSYKAYTALESINRELEKRVEDRTIKLQEEIDKRREAEEILYQSRSLLASILDSSLDGIVALKAIRDSATGKIENFCCLMSNQILARTFERRCEDLIGELVPRNLFTLLDPQLFDLFVAIVETGQPLERDFYYPWQDSCWYQFVAVKLEDGLAITVRDITVRKQIELALQSANQQLEALVNFDGLTKVANRRCFDARLQEEWKRLAREQQALSLILFDLDSFKRYNDFYGHLAGDDCLIKVAQAARASVNRASDLVARYGGEEFVVLLPNTSLEGAISVAVNIQHMIQALAIPHERSDVKSVVTVSLGIASLIPSIETQPDILIGQADWALYQAKQQGRDRYFANT
ncbi:diguanylate cyclase [Tumidithrix elongata RA019]|uniref:Diguanylate cyclase n=1 Tax=Tumidithrix elongata BACA0141 TaxID=2716417 RepID=A0AAW9Q652_9CYAN|nr:diguanylate cyclase [Tumidithrix elongata RA019]